jgi:hypothetical protein
MAASTPDRHLTWYVINYFGRLMTKAEGLAYRAFIAEGKLKAYHAPHLWEDMKTSDPEALTLRADGVDAFLLRVRDRILRDPPHQIVLNYCPKCGGLATTPKAKQCRWCHHHWRAPTQHSTE